MTSILKNILYTRSRIQATSESMPSDHHRPIGIVKGELAMKLKDQQPRYKGNRIAINRRTDRIEMIITKNVMDVVKH